MRNYFVYAVLMRQSVKTCYAKVADSPKKVTVGAGQGSL